MKGPIQIDDIRDYLLDMFPEMQLDHDLDGQLIIYTGWECASSDGFYCPIKEEEE